MTKSLISLVDDYLKMENWRIKENSNTGFSIQGLNNYISSYVNSKYWLEKIYTEEIRDAHASGRIHIHDLGLISAYCCGWDLMDFLSSGFGGVKGKVESSPPNHFSSSLGQIVNFLYTTQGETSGAAAFSNFDTLLAPYVAKDKLKYEEVKQNIQEFVFNMNVPTRVGFQCLSEDTEILTKDGWKKYNEVFIGDKIKTLNLKSKKIELQEVRGIFSDQYSGDMYSIKNDNTDQLLSPKHRAVIDGLRGSYELLSIEDCNELVQFTVPVLPELNEHIENIIVKNSDIEVIQYNGIIWCPNTINETVIARRNGKIFITGNSPFSNLTFDLKVSPLYADMPVIIAGKQFGDHTYKDFQNEMDMINRAFCETMIHGDSKGRIFTFPIPTYNITKDFDWDNKQLDPLWEMTSKYGTACFSNFVNSDMKPEDARSMCCRLRLDKREINKRGGGLFAANPMTGSIGVVTINLPRLAYESNKDEKIYFEKLDNLLNIARKSLVIKRKLLEEKTEDGLYPYVRHYLQKIKDGKGSYWANHFNTIGILGMNESCLNLFGEDITTEKGKEFAIKVLEYIRGRLVDFQEQDDQMFNLEATPGEGTTYRFAKKDKKKYKDIIVSGNNKEPYYTNSTHVPVGWSNDPFEILSHQDKLHILYSGGTITHLFLGERIDEIESCKMLVKKICDNFKLPYFSLTPTFSICPTHGYISGEHHKCPHCDDECEVYSRVVGFYRPIKNWNNGKLSEFHDRKMIDQSKF